jgi:tetratricopeptide (TPR) repeat protein
MEGARRIDEWSRIESKIPHLGVVPRFAPQDAQVASGYLDLLPFEWEILTNVNHERDIREVAGDMGRSDFEVAKAIFGLESAGLLTLEQPPALGQAAADVVADLESGLGRAEEALEADDVGLARDAAEKARALAPHDPRVHLILGRADLAERRADTAEQHLRRALRIDPMLTAAHRLLGNSLALQGRYAEAVEGWQRWMKLGEASEPEAGELEEVKQALSAVERLDSLLGGQHE